ncbi:uncharacterized protein LOC119090527 [Pollicipes pollicipes]|uniref:uncharacterized protein LOC119090527 n=1 Tax=Pollicipes pollicipes TaxID=41117 RepID=UPI0018856782|nr:uncharacterized protein LOC119090527 [Pollicipes pollicipes]
MSGACVREVCWRALLVVLLLGLLLAAPSSAFPASYSARSLAGFRVNPRGTIRVQPKADRFYPGPRFGKRSEVADYEGAPESADGEGSAEAAAARQFSLRCSLVEPEGMYRCLLGLKQESKSSE